MALMALQPPRIQARGIAAPSRGAGLSSYAERLGRLAGDASEQPGGVVRDAVSAPRDVAVGTHEHQVALVDRSRVGVVGQAQAPERDPDPAGLGLESVAPTAEVHEREAGSERVQRGASRSEADVRRPRAGPGGGAVLVPRLLRRLAVLGGDDRRLVVAVPELDPPALVLAALALVVLGQPCAARGAFGRIGVEERPIRQPLRLQVNLKVPEGPLAIAHGNRLTLDLIAVEQPRATPSLRHRGELPADVDGVGDSAVHAVAAGGNDLVGGVTREEDPAIAIAVGDEDIGSPYARLHQSD